MILVFGENQNDSRALRELVVGLCPEARGRIQIRREPPSLQRDAGPNAIRTHAARVAAVVRAEPGAVTCVLVHSDADAHDPSGTLESDRTAALVGAGLPCAKAVVPVEEIEAWWLLFPAAVESAFPAWRGALPKKVRNVEVETSPKEVLVRATRRKSPKRPYSEADSPRIAAEIVRTGALSKPAGQSPSFDRFRATVEECCERIRRSPSPSGERRPRKK